MPGAPSSFLGYDLRGFLFFLILCFMCCACNHLFPFSLSTLLPVLSITFHGFLLFPTVLLLFSSIFNLLVFQLSYESVCLFFVCPFSVCTTIHCQLSSSVSLPLHLASFNITGECSRQLPILCREHTSQEERVNSPDSSGGIAIGLEVIATSNKAHRY